mmetsp:Transcript_9976/g.32522  ORF Transcript_9976/g.32522 Transcript_9976/m.32522 type:complete len:272 (-) Transcript_9976:1740-2555(-)
MFFCLAFVAFVGGGSAQEVAVVPSLPSLKAPLVRLERSARFERVGSYVEVHLTEAVHAQQGHLVAEMNGEADDVNTISFQYLCGGGGTGETADGFSVSLGKTLRDKPELGSKEGLAVRFVDFAKSSEYGISVAYDGTTLTDKIPGDLCDEAWHAVKIEICPFQQTFFYQTSARVSLSVDGNLLLTTDVRSYQVAGNDLILAARTGDADAKHYLKNVNYDANIVQACSASKTTTLEDDYDVYDALAAQQQQLSKDKSRLEAIFETIIDLAYA